MVRWQGTSCLSGKKIVAVSDALLPRAADVFVHDRPAARLTERPGGYLLAYHAGYDGPPVSLALPLRPEPYAFASFPPFFDGLLPEGWQLEALLRSAKLDRSDLFGQLLAVGEDPVGAVTVLPASVSSASGAAEHA